MSNKFENFEDAFEKLKFTVDNFEESDKLTLDELVNNYEKGIKAYNYCKKKLEEAEKKIEVIDLELNE